MMDTEQQLKSLIDSITQQVIAQVKAEIESAVTAAVDQHASKFDSLTVEAFGRVIKDHLKNVDFPDSSIPLSALNFKERKISGDMIKGGIVENFGSTGIDDRASDCQVTILDSSTVVENNLVASSLTVKGATTLEGDLILRGVIPVDSPAFTRLIEHASNKIKSDLDESLFQEYADIVVENIKRDGLDLGAILVNGKEVIRNNQISPGITDSSLQTVGVLKQLQVSGESFLSGSFYASQRRVGINTMEPSAALTVWDEEIELQLGKRSKDYAGINTPRKQKLVIGSNGNENIVCDTDGSVQVKHLKIGYQSITSDAQAPSYESTKGTVVFNANPSLGGPMGWVCLGGATWANFGIID